MKGAQDFLALFKKTMKNKYEKFFSTESEEQQLKLKRTEFITHMRGLPPRNTSLFTLKYF